MSYRLSDAFGRLDAWLDACPDETLRWAVHDWCFELCKDPTAMHVDAVTGPQSLPVYGSRVPGTDVVVLWSLMTSPPWQREEECVLVRHVETRPFPV